MVWFSSWVGVGVVACVIKRRVGAICMEGGGGFRLGRPNVSEPNWAGRLSWSVMPELEFFLGRQKKKKNLYFLSALFLGRLGM